MPGLHLEIITPHKPIYSIDVDYVGMSGDEGNFGILPGHAPMISSLDIGALYYRVGNSTQWLFVSRALAEVRDNNVTLVAGAYELSEDIDVSRAEESKKRAEERILHPDKDTDLIRAQVSLNRAMSRLKIAKLRNS